MSNSPPFSYAKCPRCCATTPGRRNSDGTVTYRCVSPDSYSPNGERWLSAHGFRRSHVGKDVFHEWHDKDPVYQELRARNAALEKVAEAAKAYKEAVEEVVDDECRSWPVGDTGTDTILADALAMLDQPELEAR